MKAAAGGHLMNRLQDLGSACSRWPTRPPGWEQAEREKPLLVLADLQPREEEVCAAISALKKERRHRPPSDNRLRSSFPRSVA